MTLQNAFGDLALDATLVATNTTLSSILVELAQKLEPGGQVALDSTTLAALESTTATVANWPGDYPDAAALVKLEAIRVLLAGGITVSVTGTVATGALTDAQLRASRVPVDGSGVTQPVSGTVGVSGSVAVTGPATDVQLRATPLPISGTVSTGALTDAQLRASSVPVTVSDGSGPLTVDGTVAVSGVSGTVAVSGPLTDAQVRATPLPVSGTVSTGGLTDAELRASALSVTVSDGSGPLTVDGTVAVSSVGGSVAVTGPLTDTQLRATALPVSGTVAVSGVSGTVAVSGPVTDTQIRATPLPVSGAVTVSGTVATTALTDTQIRSTPLPVSGTIGVSAVGGTVAVSGPLTDAQLRAAGVPVTGAFWQATQPVSATALADGTQKTQIVDGGGDILAINPDGSLAASPTPGVGLASDASLQDAVRLLAEVISRLGMNTGTGRMMVDIGTVGTVAVSGAPTVAQSGTWTVQPGNTANTTPWLMQMTTNSSTQYGPNAWLDQHYQSIQAFDAPRAKITVT